MASVSFAKSQPVYCDRLFLFSGFIVNLVQNYITEITKTVLLLLVFMLFRDALYKLKTETTVKLTYKRSIFSFLSIYYYSVKIAF